jgi:hypothetical protein
MKRDTQHNRRSAIICYVIYAECRGAYRKILKSNKLIEFYDFSEYRYVVNMEISIL